MVEHEDLVAYISSSYKEILKIGKQMISLLRTETLDKPQSERQVDGSEKLIKYTEV